MIDKFNHVVCPGRNNELQLVFVEIHWQDRNGGMELSLTGVEGPKRNGDAHGSCGQIYPITIGSYADGWDHLLVEQLNDTWERWHLNRTRAGSPAQESWLRANKHRCPDRNNWFTWAREQMQRAGLEPDQGYRYGSAWLAEEVPDDVVQWLHDLPQAANYPWDESRWRNWP